MSKNCSIDVGNTKTKIAVFENNNAINNCSFSDDELLKNITEYKQYSVIISSVRNDSFTQKLASCFKNVLVLSAETPLPIKNKYKTPKTLGNDRIANAVAANEQFPNQNALVIDVGTCLKFDFINADNEYLGGSISLGLRMRFKALHTLTDNLPLIENVEINQLIGYDTTSSIQVGAYRGMIAEMSNMIAQYEKIHNNINIILTGGDLQSFLGIDLSQKNSIFADDLLTLKGLNTILNYNAQK